MLIISNPGFRINPVTGETVLISKGRGKSLEDLMRKSPRSWSCKQTIVSGEECPFEVGKENKTPPEVLSYRKPWSKPDEPEWWVRAVPNLWSAVDSSIQQEPLVGKLVGPFFEVVPSIGQHNVIVETTIHDRDLASVDSNQFREVINMWRDMTLKIQRDGVKQIIIFKNHGPTAGASQPHPHTQIIGSLGYLTLILNELNGSHKYFQEKGVCPYCQEILWESGIKERIVEKTDKFLAWCPFTSQYPYQMVIAPIAHQSFFGDIDNFMIPSKKDDLSDFAEILQRSLQRMKGLLNDPDYRLYIHMAPSDNPKLSYYHWHCNIRPMTNIPAAFEEATRVFMNPRPPEYAAEDLRSVHLAA